ncbi:hypothetical protein PQR34_32370 [Paraburkholderia sediminicola]|uniref:hypothetical protein n=1 Tax=Paraburkholderia sediminicola TaxID=458836 RepID=UPI0038BD0A18
MSHQDLSQAQDHTKQPKRPFYLTGTALALIAIGVFNLVLVSLLAFLPIFHHFVHSSRVMPAFIGVAALVPLALVASGIGVIRAAHWSRPLAILGLILLIVRVAFPVLSGHGWISGYGWVELVIYMCISLLLVTPRTNAFFNAPRGRS